MVFRAYTPIKFQKEWIRPLKDKMIGVLRDEVWSKWKPTLDKKVKGKIKKDETISKNLLIDRGILYWSGSMMKVKRPTSARVSKWLKDNGFDIRDSVVYGGLNGAEINKAKKIKQDSYDSMLDFMQWVSSGNARDIVDKIDIDREVRFLTDKIKEEIVGSIGFESAKKIIDDEIGWSRLEEELKAKIKQGVGGSGAFEVERFKNEGIRLLDNGSTEELENWFSKRYTGSVVEKRIDIRIESEAKEEEVIALQGYLPQAGYGRYIWTTRRDDRVRPDHARLEGGIFRWDDPPVVDLRSGRRRHPGEDYQCYEKNTEVYTKDGFKLIKEVKIGEEILTLNPDTQDLKWSRCTGKVEKHCDKIAHIYGHMFDLKVSPDHTFFVYKDIEHGKNQHIKYGTKVWYTREPQFRTGIESLSKKCNFYRSSKWIGEYKEVININGLEIPVKDYCTLMGYYLSEGNVDNRKDRNGIKISQKVYINEIFEKLAFFNPRKGKDAIWIFNAPLKNYLQQFGYAVDKYIPEEIKKLDPENIRVFLDAYALGDGTLAKKINFMNIREVMTYNQYRTSSKKMSDDLAECIIKAGMGVSIYFSKEKGKEVKFRNGVYKLNTDLYTIQELKNIYNSFYSTKMELEDYNDSVYDIEVEENHTILIKSGRCIHWNSNCRCTASPIKD